MTEYVVFQKNSSERETGDEMETYFGPLGWQEVARLGARSAASAIRLHIEDDEKNGTHPSNGTFVAVPARSWKPVTVKVETKTAALLVNEWFLYFMGGVIFATCQVAVIWMYNHW